MENDYLISIIIPVHNTANYLRKCVDSVRNQSLKSIEIILVENLSIDGSADICDEYAKLDERVKVLHLSVAGLSMARNEGLKVASAPYVGFIDSDDYIEPTMFQELLDALMFYKADFSYCNYVLDFDYKESINPFRNSGSVELCSPKDFIKDMMWEKISCSVCTKLFKKSFFNTREFPVGRLYEDRLVMHEWVLTCDTIVWVDKPFYHYVERLDSICHTVTPFNYYHYFLAEFSRVEFVNRQNLFKGKGLCEVQTMMLRICFSIFKDIMLRVKPGDFQEPIDDMRHKMKELFFLLKKGELEPCCYRKLWKLIYLWPVYRLIHYNKFKRSKI